MRITLITDVLPVEAYTAGQVLQRIFDALDTEVDILWINQSRLPQPEQLGRRFRIVREYRFALPDWLGAPLHRLLNALGLNSAPAFLLQVVITSLEVLAIAGRIIRRRKRTRQDDILWLVLQGEKLLSVYTLVAWFERGTTLLHQWDPLSWWMENRNHKSTVIRVMSRVLKALQRRVSLNLVPSDAWAEHLRQNGCRAHRIDNFFSNTIEGAAYPLIRARTPGKLNAVFIGQLYANRELDRCLNILVQASRSLSLQLVLHYFGDARWHGTLPVELVNHGFRPRDEVVAMMAKWDFGILPYPMDDKYAETARFSFPSKGRAYVAAGLPVLAYAPITSSVEGFFARHYGDYYVNAKTTDVSTFLSGRVNESLREAEVRRSYAHQTLQEWFSEQAELDPLRRILKANLTEAAS